MLSLSLLFVFGDKSILVMGIVLLFFIPNILKKSTENHTAIPRIIFIIMFKIV